ncbi:MAG: FGGY-family carbohydrate kinase [Gammaproteobacteria bacterium]
MDSPGPLFVGIDLGTSGCRAVAIDRALRPVAGADVAITPPQRRDAHSEQDAASWWNAVDAVMATLTARIDPRDIHALAVAATSGTVVLTDDEGTPVMPALLYNDARAREQAARIAATAPPASGAHGASSGLAKLLYLQAQAASRTARHVLNQAEWIAARFTGRYDLGDENNCLKLGYDVIQRRWPNWLDALGVNRMWLPRVTAPGSPQGPVTESVSRRFGLAPHCQIVAGTTDSIAGFLATGAERLGEAVTSLGSTLAVKILSKGPVFAPDCGVYSHRLGTRWLAGGASNSGGAVLRHYFSQAELDALTPQLDPEHPTGLDYYPLLTPGERFPVADPEFMPRLSPRPSQALQFFQGMLEGMARIEADAYRRLAAMGAPFPGSVRTVGGGAVNAAWTRIRARELKVPMIAPRHTEAAYGAALLAAGRTPP